VFKAGLIYFTFIHRNLAIELGTALIYYHV